MEGSPNPDRWIPESDHQYSPGTSTKVRGQGHVRGQSA